MYYRLRMPSLFKMFASTREHLKIVFLKKFSTTWIESEEVRVVVLPVTLSNEPLFCSSLKCFDKKIRKYHLQRLLSLTLFKWWRLEKSFAASFSEYEWHLVIPWKYGIGCTCFLPSKYRTCESRNWQKKKIYLIFLYFDILKLILFELLSVSRETMIWTIKVLFFHLYKIF